MLSSIPHAWRHSQESSLFSPPTHAISVSWQLQSSPAHRPSWQPRFRDSRLFLWAKELSQFSVSHIQHWPFILDVQGSIALSLQCWLPLPSNSHSLLTIPGLTSSAGPFCITCPLTTLFCFLYRIITMFPLFYLSHLLVLYSSMICIFLSKFLFRTLHDLLFFLFKSDIFLKIVFSYLVDCYSFKLSMFFFSLCSKVT